MRVLSKDYYELEQLKRYVSDGKSFRVEDLKKEVVGQAILDNKYFHDFDLDGVVTYNDYLIAWNWVTQGKPTDIREFVRDRGASPMGRKLPYQYIQDKSYDSVSVAGLPPDNRVPPETDPTASIEMSADWDSDGEIDEVELKILEHFILSRPTTPEEYNRSRGRYPITKKLPNLLTAKYLPDNLEEVDWNDLLVFNEWLRQGKPTTYKEFNADSVEGMDWGGDSSTKIWFITEGGHIIPAPPMGEVIESAIEGKTTYLALEEYAGPYIFIRLEFRAPYDRLPLRRVSGPGMGFVTGSISHQAYPLENAFDDILPEPFWEGLESGSMRGGWVTWQQYMPYVYIQYQFADYVKQQVTEYEMAAGFVSPPKRWVLQGANREDLFTGAGNQGETAWKVVDTVVEEGELPDPILVSGLDTGVPTGSVSQRFGPNNAFDGSKDTRWRGMSNVLPFAYLQFQFHGGEKKKVTQYKITSSQQVRPCARSWKLQGINVDALFQTGIWDDLAEISDETDWGEYETRTYGVENPGYYEYYRLLISEITEEHEYIQISKLELFEQEGDLVFHPWRRGTTRKFVVDNPGEYEYYRFIFSHAYDDETYMGLHEIRMFGEHHTHILPYIGKSDQALYLYALPYQKLRTVTLDGLLPPLAYEQLGIQSQLFDDVYVGAENL